MKLASTLIAVKDMARARKFYTEVMGMTVTDDFGADVVMDGVLALQTLESWKEFIAMDESAIKFKNNCGELYFDCEDIDALSRRIEGDPEIKLVHPLKEHSWGQRALRFYDPDGHIIEVGEKLSCVVKRFMGQGMDASQVARRMEVPEALVLACMEEQ